MSSEYILRKHISCGEFTPRISDLPSLVPKDMFFRHHWEVISLQVHSSTSKHQPNCNCAFACISRTSVVSGLRVLRLRIRLCVFCHGIVEDLVPDLSRDFAVVKRRGGLRMHGEREFVYRGSYGDYWL